MLHLERMCMYLNVGWNTTHSDTTLTESLYCTIFTPNKVHINAVVPFGCNKTFDYETEGESI
jgi:hypothetical protein